jgi:hypothetical protein
MLKILSVPRDMSSCFPISTISMSFVGHCDEVTFRLLVAPKRGWHRGLETGIGSALVLTAWIIRRDEDFPLLTTCYIL